MVYVVTTIVLIGLNLILLLFPPPFILTWFELVTLPAHFKFLLLLIVIANSITILIAEQVHHYAFVNKDICKDQAKSTKKYAK